MINYDIYDQLVPWTVPRAKSCHQNVHSIFSLFLMMQRFYWLLNSSLCCKNHCCNYIHDYSSIIINIHNSLIITEARAAANQYDSKYAETSAALNHHVDELLVGVLSQIRLKHDPGAVEEHEAHKTHKEHRKGSFRIAKGILTKLFRKHSKKDKSCENLYELWRHGCSVCIFERLWFLWLCICVYVFFFIYLSSIYLKLFFLDIKHMNLHVQICMQLELSGCISSYIVLHNWCMIRTLL